MSRILITSGPTRQYLDPVRYLSNASSGRMGCALAEAALAAGHEVVVVTGPVDVAYPAAAQVIRVESTDEMLEACRRVFPACNGLIAAAAPCDYRPAKMAEQKIPKDGRPLTLELVETPDVVASLAEQKGSRWIVIFALETESGQQRAVEKLRRKRADLVVVNDPEAISSSTTNVEVLDPRGQIVTRLHGEKREVAGELLGAIASRLIGDK